MNGHIIQNPDINVGPGAYRQMAPDALLVTSVFFTIQGEGPYAGHPAIFVRLAGCNRGRKEGLGCPFCDTAFQYHLGKSMTFPALELAMLDEITKVYKRSSYKDLVVVITGGEPMMQNNLAEFCRFLQNAHWGVIQIESNGDRLVDNLPAGVELVVSPKVSKLPASAGPGYEYKEPNPDVFDRANYFKFLVEDVEGSPYRQPPSWADICARPVYVSPITKYVRPVNPEETPSAWNYRLIDAAATRANYAHAAALAMRCGYWVSTQTHLFYGVP